MVVLCNLNVYSLPVFLLDICQEVQWHKPHLISEARAVLSLSLCSRGVALCFFQSWGSCFCSEHSRGTRMSSHSLCWNTICHLSSHLPFKNNSSIFSYRPTLKPVCLLTHNGLMNSSNQLQCLSFLFLLLLLILMLPYCIIAVNLRKDGD